jgi:hypothetical protein
VSDFNLNWNVLKNLVNLLISELMITCPGFLQLFHAYRRTDIGAILLALGMVAKATLTIVYNRSVGNGNFKFLRRTRRRWVDNIKMDL